MRTPTMSSSNIVSHSDEVRLRTSHTFLDIPPYAPAPVSWQPFGLCGRGCLRGRHAYRSVVSFSYSHAAGDRGSVCMRGRGVLAHVARLVRGECCLWHWMANQFGLCVCERVCCAPHAEAVVILGWLALMLPRSSLGSCSHPNDQAQQKCVCW